MTPFDWKKHVTDCLRSTDFCSLATVDPNGVWSNPVYFAYDDAWNVYFISQLSSRHMKNIERDQRISVSIYSTQQKENAIGIQMEGKATILNEKEDIMKAMTIYHQRTGEKHDLSEYMDQPTWTFVKISPAKIWYFNAEEFGEERQEVSLK